MLLFEYYDNFDNDERCHIKRIFLYDPATFEALKLIFSNTWKIPVAMYVHVHCTASLGIRAFRQRPRALFVPIRGRPPVSRRAAANH